MALGLIISITGHLGRDNDITFFFCGTSMQFKVIASPYRALQSHSLDTLNFVERLWARISPTQRPLPDNTQHSQETSMPPSRIETHNLSKGVATDPPLKLHDH